MPAMAGGFGRTVPPLAILDTAWSWWSRPRAVSHGGVAYVGSTAKDGSVVVDEWTSPTSRRKRHRISPLLGEEDDHNNPALVLEVGKPPIVFYARHNVDWYLRLRIGTENFVAGAGLGSFGPERMVSFESVPYVVTYAQAFVHGANILVFVRAAASTKWAYTKSTDWGATWSTPIAVFTSDNQHYLTANLVGDTLRCALSTHPVNGSPPNQNVYYAEIDLLSGAITSAGATVGNLDGTSLPLTWSTLEQIGTPAAGLVTWVYDVSDGPDPEVVWASFNHPDITISTYHYTRKSAGAWTSHDVVAAGGKFPSGSEPYLGGAQFPYQTPGGVVVVSRKNGSTWQVDRCTTGDGGTSWSFETLLSDPLPVVRAWPVEQRDATEPPFEVAANWITSFPNYDDFECTVGPLRE